MKSVTLATLAASLALITPATATCDPSTLNTTTYYYPITEANTTVFDVARITKRGVCDISRQNPMAGCKNGANFLLVDRFRSIG
ncbi:hypothetical protein BDV37DRAFT_286382 [Aspergillus pseudonomiae]|uniref:LysM domain-containing protein n=1 Tax=Aspergillus pseudonomiae TaxID=1506151 RepID=A0A5N7D3E4_9EURO|nr:uncharacterized protein BDV37DRAFT_286382 [Aspergillus pseudonomiae]KAE8400637.1 hypothetical protein BDV37DRAFT_286382 [Aspergillus pseudonomiae]